jgi:hypothetical protein
MKERMLCSAIRIFRLTILVMANEPVNSVETLLGADGSMG